MICRTCTGCSKVTRARSASLVSRLKSGLLYYIFCYMDQIRMMILFGNYQLSNQGGRRSRPLEPFPHLRPPGCGLPPGHLVMVIMTRILVMTRMVIISKMAMAMDNGHGGPHWIILWWSQFARMVVATDQNTCTKTKTNRNKHIHTHAKMYQNRYQCRGLIL